MSKENNDQPEDQPLTNENNETVPEHAPYTFAQETPKASLVMAYMLQFGVETRAIAEYFNVTIFGCGDVLCLFELQWVPSDSTYKIVVQDQDHNSGILTLNYSINKKLGTPAPIEILNAFCNIVHSLVDIGGQSHWYSQNKKINTQ